MSEDLKSRLLHIDHGDGGSQWPRNPDGVEAVKEIDAKDAEIERLRAQLEWYGDKTLLARAEKTISDSGIAALREDAGERAREALKGGDDA